MSAIDTQNKKQIRDPMDVLITLTLDNTDISMAYSGYSSTAKVADGVLDQKDWPMRGLADLQEDGFPLDGSCVLYDSTTSPSQANGKLGVRGNVGQSVGVTATGDGTIASIGIDVTGAASVTLNGETTEIMGSSVSLPLLNTTAALTFAPASETERIEIIDIFPETDFKVTNDNLIKATVSLRSDLSRFDPTLPESELNVEVYHDIDISEAVAQIPDDTPITYQAGYPGDMSPVRKFYVSGQVTWADNVLNIHAVDAVHFLDAYQVEAPIVVSDVDYLEKASRYMLDRAGIDYVHNGRIPYVESYAIIPKGTKFRDFIAFLNQALNVTNNNGRLIDGSARLTRAMRYSFVDAGIPRIECDYRRGFSRTIREEDCSVVKQQIDIPVSEVKGVYSQITNANNFYDYHDASFDRLGSATLIKGVGATLNFERISYVWTTGLTVDYSNWGVAEQLLNKYHQLGSMYWTAAIVPATKDGWKATNGDDEQGYVYAPIHTLPTISAKGDIFVGRLLMDENVPQESYASYPPNPDENTPYSMFVPWGKRFTKWNCFPLAGGKPTVAQVWNAVASAGIFDADANAVNLDINGFGVSLETKAFNYASNLGAFGTHNYDELALYGSLLAPTDNGPVEIYPKQSVTAPMYRSPVTCSFTWKGDPRLQPRSVFTFDRLSGEIEAWTIETITLTHEKGGTMAEITARKGDV